MGSTLSFLDQFSVVADHRVPGMVTYPLNELLLSTLVGVVCGAQDWEEIVDVGEELLAWLRQFLPFDKGIAPAQTHRIVFRALDSDTLAACFMRWVSSLTGQVKGVVAIDGKTLRGSKQDASGKGALHLLSAYAHEAGLVIGQRAVDGKSNEITAIPELLEALALAGAIVTIDAMGTQKEIAAKIIAKEADYLLALKGNQGTLHEDVRVFFEEAGRDVAWQACETVDAGHGRVETRRCTVTSDIAWLRERHPEWSRLRSIVRIDSERALKKAGTVIRETRYYITSLTDDATAILRAVRSHWSVENNLHWQLDVTFREDACRTRKDHAALNLAMIRHAAYNLLKRDPTRLSLKRKRLKASLNNDYRTKLFAC